MKLKLHAFQTKVFESKARFTAAIAGKRGGKTVCGATWLCQRIYQDYQAGKRGNYLIIAPTNSTIIQATMPTFKQFFPKDWGTWKEAPKSYFQLNWNVTGIDGKDTDEPARIFVRSMDDPNAIEGMDVLAIWADEVGFMKDSAWPAIEGRSTTHRCPVLMTSTPYSMNWVYTKIYKPFKDGDPDYNVIQWRSVDNPNFSKKEFERLKRSMTKALFERLHGGQFTRLEGMVYPDFDEEEHVVKPFPIPSTGVVFAGADFGHNNPNAIVYIWKNPETNVFYVFKEYYKSKVLLKDIAYSINSINPAYVLADSQAAQNIAELKRFHGIKQIKPADKVKEVGFQRINALLRENRLKIFSTCVNTIDEIKSYHYKPPSPDGSSKEEVVDKFNHCMDALRYAFSRAIAGLYTHRPHKNYKAILAARMARLAPDNQITGY